MKNKRGQITVFIIIGILILLLTAFFITYQKELFVFKPKFVIPPEVAPINDYVIDCINKVGEEGIRLIAANGGYIRFPPEISTNPAAYINSNKFFPDIKTPLWRFGGQTKLPTEDYMAEDLKYYISQNIKQCLNLEPFDTLFSITRGEPSLDVVLADNGVDITLYYPLSIEIVQKNQTAELNQFRITIPLRLKEVYELAKQIMEEENRDLFLEKTTIDLIALDPEIPYTDMEFTCTPRIWFISNIEEKLKQLLSFDLPLIRVDKTKYAPVPLNRPYEEMHYRWEVTSLNYPTTRVSFTYDEAWPVELYINPSRSGILKSNAQKGQDMLSFLCIHLWHFTYDIKYPVMVTITDEASKDYKSLNFNFGFQVGVNHNAPDKTNFGTSYFDFKEKADPDEYCYGAQGNILTVHTFENVSTEQYGDLVKEIDNVNISFTCLKYTCYMGESEWTFRGAVASLSEEFPYCVNGILKAGKKNYEDAMQFITTDEEKTAQIYLTPTITKPVKVVKHYKYALSEERPLEDETAIITLRRNNMTYSTAMFSANPSQEEIEAQTYLLKLLAKWDYEYDVEIYLVNEDMITGGYLGKWVPAWADLKNAREIKFHVYEWPYTQNEITQFEYLASLKDDSKLVPLPQFGR